MPLLPSPSRAAPAIVTLPAPDGELIRVAHAVVAASAMLMAPAAPQLIGVSVKGRHAAIGTWNERFEPCANLPETVRDASLRPMLNALRRDAAGLVAVLRPRWPDYARPSALGLVSDGIGIAFSPDDPDPFAAGWIARLATGEISLVQILPLAPASALSRMVLPAAYPRGQA